MYDKLINGWMKNIYSPMHLTFENNLISMCCSGLGPTCFCCHSVAKLCLTLCYPMDCNSLGFPVLHCLPEFARTHVHWVCEMSIQLPHPLSPPSPSALILSQQKYSIVYIKPAFSLSSFMFIKRHFSSSSLSAIRVVSSAYLRLLIFLPAILIPACASSSPAFLMM